MATTTDGKYPAQTDEAYPEPFITIPTQPKESKPGQLNPDLVKQFFAQGYVVVEDYFPKEMLDACRAGVEEQVEELAQKLYKAGKITSESSSYIPSFRAMFQSQMLGTSFREDIKINPQTL